MTRWLPLVVLPTLLLAILISSAIKAEEYAVISMNSELLQLKSIQVKMLYRGKIDRIGEHHIKLLDLPPKSDLRKNFYLSLLNKNPSQMQSIWAKQSFSGRASAPFQLQSEDLESVLIWLKSTPTGIAYYPIEQLPTHVKILYIIKIKEEL
ncbi:hypothetical protein ACFFUS_12825 [Vibrio gallaecicus]|uniref:hypothetical protein n=1 Tax=Vibrio gallaecicus TaxID=552386 RepID=UPI0010C9D0B1|nr:hypothetical protein [Vibrio gallaecicus]MDN3617686.1 hypothetical protein [Vibrio gallaecicus]